MVGNVTGVSLLETVSAPMPQTGAEAVPGQTFAAVMQQAGTDAGTTLPPATSSGYGSPVKEAATEKTSDTQNSRSAHDVSTTQGDVAKLDSGAKSDRVTPLISKAVGLQSHVKTSQWTESGKTQNVLQNATVSSTIAVDAKAVTLDDTDASAALATGGKGVSNVTAAPPAVGETAPADFLAVVQDAGVKPGVSQGAGKGDVTLQPVSVPKKNGKETPSVESRPTAKPVVEPKGDSTLTALVPQSVATVPQSDAAAVSLNAAATPVVPTLKDLPEPTPEKDVANVSATSITALPAAKARGMAPQASVPSIGTEVVAAGSLSEASSGAVHVREAGLTVSVPQQTQPASSPATTAIKSVAPSSAVVAQASSEEVLRPTPTQAAQPKPTVLDERQDAMSAEMRSQNAVPSFAGEPAKQTVSTSKNVQATADAVAGPIAPRQVVPTPEPAASTTLPTAVVAATPSTTQAVATVSGDVATEKTAEITAVPVRRSAPQTKTAALPDGLAANSSPSKEALAAPVSSSVHPVASQTDSATATAPMAVPVASANASLPSSTSSPGTQTSVSPAGGVSSTGSIGATAEGGLAHTTLSSTPTSLEVGVSSGTHGWLKIRAELNAAGEVNASLTGANAAAADKLRGDLPALSSFLQTEKVAMGTLDVRSTLHTVSQSFEGGSMFSQTGSGQPGSGQPGSGQSALNQSGQGSTQLGADAGTSGDRAHQQPHQDTSSLRGTESIAAVQDKILPGRNGDTAAYGIHTELGGSEGSPSRGYGTGGGWLNVRA